MGFYYVLGPCLSCKQPFVYNPNLVPSHPARSGEPSDDPTDPTEPICESCITTINAFREKAGLETWSVHADAYRPAEGFPE